MIIRKRKIGLILKNNTRNSITHLNPIANINVIDEIVLIIDVTKEGVVYFKLAKNMFRVRPILFFVMKVNKEDVSFFKIWLLELNKCVSV